MGGYDIQYTPITRSNCCSLEVYGARSEVLAQSWPLVSRTEQSRAQQSRIGRAVVPDWPVAKSQPTLARYFSANNGHSIVLIVFPPDQRVNLWRLRINHQEFVVHINYQGLCLGLESLTEARLGFGVGSGLQSRPGLTGKVLRETVSAAVLQSATSARAQQHLGPGLYTHHPPSELQLGPIIARLQSPSRRAWLSLSRCWLSSVAFEVALY